MVLRILYHNWDSGYTTEFDVKKLTIIMAARMPKSRIFCWADLILYHEYVSSCNKRK